MKGGELREEDLLSDYISLTNIEHERNNFALYDKIYDSVSKEVRGKKLDLEEMVDQTVRNTIYIRENLKIQGNIDRKKELKEAMKRLRIIK